MKNKIGLSLSIIAFSGAGFAETTPVAITATAPVNGTAQSTYNWTGVYVGGFVGGASGANGTNSSATTTNGFGSPIQQSNSSNYSTGGSFMGGGTVGYNWQIPKTPYLIGLEGEYGSLGLSGSSQSHSVGRGGESITSTVNTQSKTTIGSDYGYGLIGGRIGYALDRSLFYVKSGAVFTQTNTTNSMSGTVTSLSEAASSSSRGTTTGYAIGGGVEYVPTYYNNKNLTVKVEYLYFGIPTSTSSSSTANNTAFCEGACSMDTNYHNSTGGISTAKIGVNYKF
jgi:outer membrane immunogenic protein